jgi:hypothetical protein
LRAGGEQGQGDGAPLPHGVRGPDFEQDLLEALELLALLAVHAEEVAREDELPDHGHGHGHEDVAAADAVVEVRVDVGAVEDGVVEAVDDLLVVDLRGQAAGAHVGELGEAEDPLLHVAAEGLAPVVEVVHVADAEEVGGGRGGGGGGEDLFLHVPDLGLGLFELRPEGGDLGVFLGELGDVRGDFVAGLGVLRLQPAIALRVGYCYLGVGAVEAFVDFS